MRQLQQEGLLTAGAARGRMSIMFAGLERAIGNMDVACHEAIVDAIASGDAAAAAAAVHDHMGWAADNLTD